MNEKVRKRELKQQATEQGVIVSNEQIEWATSAGLTNKQYSRSLLGLLRLQKQCHERSISKIPGA